MEIKLGTVSSIVDDKKFVIKFTIPKYVENAIAYPIDVKDAPEENEVIFIYELESVFGYSFYYQKTRLEDHTRLKLRGTEIDLSDEGLSITVYGKNEDQVERSILMTSEGDITIQGSNLNIIVDKLEGQSPDPSHQFNIKVNGTVKLDAKSIEVPAGGIVGGAPGPFNAIHECPYSKQIHSGNTITYT